MPENEKRCPAGWYPSGHAEASELRAWYAPASDAREAGDLPAARADEAGQIKRRRTKIISLSVCAVILLCAAILAVWKLASGQRRPAGHAPAPPAADSGEFDNFREYFETYYSSSSAISIERAENGTGVELALHPAGRHELSLQEIYEKVSPAVIGISAYRDGQLYSWGSGVIFTEDGYIITNTHIIAGSDQAVAELPDGRRIEVLLVGADESSDIAVLKMDGDGFPAAQFGDSDTLRVGDLAVAIGNPIGQQYAGTMTDGIISAINRNVKNNGHNMTLLQTNAALNEGNSGGPLVNDAGQVIGITNMKIMSTYFVTVEGIGFAIPSTVVKQIADQLIELGYVPGEPTIGITAGPVSAEAMQLYGLPVGVYVAEVKDGSDAGRQGLLVGDIITAVNGVPVTSVAEVNVIKDGFSVGDTLVLTVYRSGESFELPIMLVDSVDVTS